MRILAVTLIYLLSACSDTQSLQPPATAAEPRNLPPGFLDEPPPPPTSNTQVLSGGTLVADTVIEDSVVVLSEGRVIAWGKRGAVDMPNDSVGFDLRGRWITPGRWEHAVSGKLSEQSELVAGQVANLLIFKRPPPYSKPDEGDLGGRVVDGTLELFDA